MRLSLTVSTSFGVLFLIALSSFAQLAGPGTYDLTWHTIDGGGGTSTGGGPGGFSLTGTIGQHDASSVPMTGGNFSLSGGFWPAAGPTPNTCPPDIAPLPNGDDLVNVGDLLAVISAWGVCPAPPATCLADIAPTGGNGAVNVADLLAVIGGWGACP